MDNKNEELSNEANRGVWKYKEAERLADKIISFCETEKISLEIFLALKTVLPGKIEEKANQIIASTHLG